MAFFFLPMEALNELFKVVQAFANFLYGFIFAPHSHDVLESTTTVVPDLLLDRPCVHDIPRLNRELLVVVATDLSQAWLRTLDACLRLWK
jgi:hypothetical protein